MSEPQLCQYCDNPAAHACTGCEVTFYCCENCQTRSWTEEEHRLLCHVSVKADSPGAEKWDLDVLVQALRAVLGESIDAEAMHIAARRSHRRGHRSSHLSAAKAREILHDGTVHGHPITERQRRFFGWVAGGGK